MRIADSTADPHVIGTRGGERQCCERNRDQPEQRAFELLTQLETQDFPEHCSERSGCGGVGGLSPQLTEVDVFEIRRDSVKTLLGSAIGEYVEDGFTAAEAGG